ncbi:hypothetical protein MMC07_000033 [Pseudocyphellaria aurata]|nr:hypothetical protein [Pseudocyphellaria aurata]
MHRRIQTAPLAAGRPDPLNDGAIRPPHHLSLQRAAGPRTRDFGGKPRSTTLASGLVGYPPRAGRGRSRHPDDDPGRLRGIGGSPGRVGGMDRAQLCFSSSKMKFDKLFRDNVLDTGDLLVIGDVGPVIHQTPQNTAFIDHRRIQSAALAAGRPDPLNDGAIRTPRDSSLQRAAGPRTRDVGG